MNDDEVIMKQFALVRDSIHILHEEIATFKRRVKQLEDATFDDGK